MILDRILWKELVNIKKYIRINPYPANVEKMVS